MQKLFSVISMIVSAVLGQFALHAADAPTPRTNSSVLSAPTNSLQAGVVMDNPEGVIHVRNGKVMTSIYFVLVNSSTNGIQYFDPQKIVERLELEMVDSKGKRISLTDRGRAFGASLSLPSRTPLGNWKQQGLMKGYVPPNDEIGEFWWSSENENQFDWNSTFLQCFAPISAGDYRLCLIRRIYLIEGGLLKPMTFPSITVPVRVDPT